MRLVFGPSQEVLQYIRDRTGIALTPPVRTIGAVDRQGTIIGGAAFTHFTGFGINLTLAGRASLMRSFMQEIGNYAFGVCGCRRLEATTLTTNKAVRRIAPRLGFKFEGRLRGYFGEADAFVYSLLSNEAIERGLWKPRPEAKAA